MTKYFTQFDESTQTVGTNTVGWTPRGRGTLMSSYAPIIAAANQDAVKRRRLAHKVGNGASLLMANILTLDAIDADANRATVDQVTMFTYDATFVATQPHLWARGVGIPGQVDEGYFARWIPASNSFRITRRNGATTVTDLATGTVTAESGHTYFMRFQVGGTTLKAKLWDATLGAAGEPTAWDLTVTDATWSSAGWCGLGSLGATAGDSLYYNFLSVGTNGDAPDIPITEAEFDAWCDDQSKQREILAEFSALGFDPTGAGSPAYTRAVNAYISRLGFTSRAHDVPASQHYPAIITGVPSFSVEMPSALGGEARVNFGDLVIDNARPSVQPQESTTVGLAFDGVSQKVTLSATTNVPATYTVEAWVQADVSAIGANQFIIFTNLGSGAAVDGMVVGISNGSVFLTTFAGSVLKLANNTTIPVFSYGNIAFHIAVVVDNGSSTVSMYVNGVSVAVTGGWVSSASSTNGGTIGAYNAQFQEGRVDEVRLWNTARTAAEILAYKNVRATGSETGLIGCWHMDEGSGTTTADASPTGNTGTLTSASMWSMTGMPKASTEWGGVRDDWLRMKFNKNYLRMWVGDKNWPKHDFREYITGVIGQPTAPNETTINFKIADLSAFFQKDLQTSLFTSGAYSGQRKPIFMGQIGRGSHVGGQIEPPLTDVANLIYTISDAAIGAWYTSLTDYIRVFDRQTELRTAALTNSAIAGNTLTSSAPHGMVVNYLWRSPASGALPTPLALNTDYWVQSAPTTTTFTLSATRGGAVITLTSATLVAVASYGYGYTVTTTAPASIQLASGDSTQMRITVSDILTSAAGAYATGFTPKQVYADIIARTGLSANFIDAGTVYSLSNDCGLWWDTQKHSAGDALNTLANGTLSFYGFSVDGLFYSGAMAVPAGTAVQSFGQYNIVANSLSMVGTRKAVDFSKAEIKYAPWFLTGSPFPSGSQAALQGYSVATPTVYGATSPPLDAHPDAGEADQLFSVTHFFTSSTPVTVYSTFYAKPVDEFEFKTTLRAYRRRVGDVISVTHPRFGFKQWSVTDPASLDNTATIDGTLCVVDRVSVDVLANPPVSLRVYKPKIGFYPTGNLT